jgi:CRISPR-associated protein Cas6
MALTGSSRLTLRAPATFIPELLVLSGKVLEIEEHKLVVGVPTMYPLRPAAFLYSRLVSIKGFMDEAGFGAAAQRQLDALGIKGKLRVGPRRTTRIKDKEVVGYAVAVSELDADESILLQEQGIGGRRRFGCGVFAPRMRI